MAEKLTRDGATVHIRPHNAAQAALPILNLPRLCKQLSQEIQAIKENLKAAAAELRIL
ncbi:hypothetical protein GCM10022409_48480 [Hymenobacter glaciei]|uniref:Uncharacterized protein n=1 Tax=Hymenobacter glaciei TaxID=877209 RepID=A0ABP7UYV7_9BACT